MEVTKNALDKLHMSVAWLMHEKAHLLDDIRYVRPGQGEILKRACKTAVICGVGEKLAMGEGQLGARVYGGRDGLTM